MKEITIQDFKALVINFHEGVEIVTEGHIFTDFLDANIFLMKIAVAERDAGGGYCKVDYTMHTQCGDQIKGRLDVHCLSHESQETRNGQLCWIEAVNS